MAKNKWYTFRWRVAGFLIVAALIFNYATYRINQNTPENKTVWESKKGKVSFLNEYSKKRKRVPQLSISHWLIPSKPLELLKGQIILLDFWGVWCGPCREKLPKTQKVYDTNGTVEPVAQCFRTQPLDPWLSERYGSILSFSCSLCYFFLC